MGRVNVILGILGISIIGIIKIISDYKKMVNKINYSVEFLDKYREYANGVLQENINEELYQWIKLRSSKMQNMMGSYGIANSYQPPLSDLIYRNHQIIVNGLSEIRRSYSLVQNTGSSLAYGSLNEIVRMIDDCILLYVGHLNDLEEEIVSDIKNPFRWFREGIRFIVLLPISFLHWSGMINYNTYNKITNNLIVKIFTTIITLIGFISSIIGIVQGYDYLVIIFNNIKELL